MSEERIKEAKESESCISAELFYFLKNAIRSLVYEDTKCEFKEVIPEFPIVKGRIDQIVFVSKYGKALQPFLVIEVKKRTYEKPGLSLAKASEKALSYARDLTPTPFFAVYDGWELLIFRDLTPYLIGVYGSLKDEYQTRNLLLGLEEFSYTNKKETLNRLPKHPDRNFLIKKILPSIAREFAKDSSEAETFLKNWVQIL